MTIVLWSHMPSSISKSQFKPRALEYLREVESKKITLTITHFGKPIAKIVPYNTQVRANREVLRTSVISYKDPFEPVVKDKEWGVLK